MEIYLRDSLEDNSIESVTKGSTREGDKREGRKWLGPATNRNRRCWRATVQMDGHNTGEPVLSFHCVRCPIMTHNAARTSWRCQQTSRTTRLPRFVLLFVEGFPRSRHGWGRKSRSNGDDCISCQKRVYHVSIILSFTWILRNLNWRAFFSLNETEVYSLEVKFE